METMQPEVGMVLDKWIFITFNNGKEIRSAILSGFYGGYLHGNSWRLSSALEDVINDEESSAFYAKTVSGSTYRLPYVNIGTTGDTAAILAKWMQQVEDNPETELHTFASYEECELFCSRFQYVPTV